MNHQPETKRSAVRICILLITLLMLVAGNTPGIRPNPLAAQESRESQPQEWADNFDARFLPRNPTIGEPAPEVGGFDEEGYLFDLNETRGKHTVIVFGCLT